MANLKNIIYLSNEDFETLVSTGTVTIDGTTLTYDENCLYITPDKLASSSEDGLMSASDKAKIDSLATVATTGAYSDLSGKPTLGTAAALNTGTSQGNIPVLGSGGKLADSVIPATAITDTYVVNSQAAMLALDAQVGDVAVRTDINKSFILKTAGASTLANWQELLTPTDAVQTVNGLTGNVVLSLDNTQSEGITYIESITDGSASGTGSGSAAPHGHKHSYDKATSVSLGSSTSTDGVEYVEDITTNSSPATSKYIHWSAGTTPKSSAAPTHTPTNTGNNSGDKVEAIIGLPNFSGGSADTAYLHHTHTAASLGTPSKEDAAPHNHTHNVTVNGTTAATTATAIQAYTSISAAGKIVGTRSESGSGASLRRTLAVTHNDPTFGTDNVAANSHTHSYGSTTALTTTGNSGTKVEAVTGYPNFSGGSGSLIKNTTQDTGDLIYVYGHTPASLGTLSKGDAAPHEHTHSYDKTTGVNLTAGTAPSLTFNDTSTDGHIYVESISGKTVTNVDTKYFHPSVSTTPTDTETNTGTAVSTISGVSYTAPSPTTKHLTLEESN